jgi:hypothetical protein
MLTPEMKLTHLKRKATAAKNKNHTARKEWICATGVVSAVRRKAQPKSIREDTDVSHGTGTFVGT